MAGGRRHAEGRAAEGGASPRADHPSPTAMSGRLSRYGVGKENSDGVHAHNKLRACSMESSPMALMSSSISAEVLRLLEVEHGVQAERGLERVVRSVLPSLRER